MRYRGPIDDFSEMSAYIGNPGTTRLSATEAYSRALAGVAPNHPTYWRVVNNAIAIRWGITGLKAVKRDAERLLRGAAEEAT